MGVKHTVPASLPTGTVSGKVAGDDWRAEHNHIPFQVRLIGGFTATALATTAGTAELANGSTRTIIDLAYATQIRLVPIRGNIAAGGTSQVLQVEWSTDQSTWAAAHTTGTVNMMTGTTGDAQDGGWVNLESGAKVDSCALRLVTVTVGTQTTAAQIRSVDAYFR